MCCPARTDVFSLPPSLHHLASVVSDKVFATMLTRFYKEEELYDKPDSELEGLMSQSPF